MFHLALTPAAILAEFKAGRLSLASDLFPEDAAALRQQPELAAGYRETPRLLTCLLVMNVHRGPLAELELRQRLAAALDVDALARTVGRLAMPAHGLIPPGLLGYDRAHRRAGAHRAGWPSSAEVRAAAPDRVELTAAVHPVYAGEYAAFARALLDGLRERGFHVRPVTASLPEFLDAARSASVDLVLGRWLADFPDADTFAYGLLHTRRGSWGRLCGTAEIDALAERGRAETDPAARHSLYRRVEEAIVRDVLMLPLFHEQIYRFAAPDVEGLSVRVSPPTVAYEELSFRR
jgi:peptide/nickel transport system substrate-binding protein